jgi:hypothetical protein
MTLSCVQNGLQVLLVNRFHREEQPSDLTLKNQRTNCQSSDLCSCHSVLTSSPILLQYDISPFMEKKLASSSSRLGKTEHFELFLEDSTRVIFNQEAEIDSWTH